MSRHRDVRCMKYSDEYDYDDVYGHSVEDDYCVSPSAEQFMFDRNKQQNIASFFTEPDIIEDNEEVEEVPPSYKKPELSDLQKTKLVSCIESIRNVVGNAYPESELNKRIIESDYNTEVVLDALLNETTTKSEREQVTKTSTDIPSGSLFDRLGSLSDPQSKFSIPKLSFDKRRNDSPLNDKNMPKNNEESAKEKVSFNPSSFGSLADLTAHHLKISSNQKSENKKIDSPSKFVIPKCSFDLKPKKDKPNFPSNLNVFPKPLENKINEPKQPNLSTFSSLADLTAHHLNISTGENDKKKTNLTSKFETLQISSKKVEKSNIAAKPKPNIDWGIALNYPLKIPAKTEKKLDQSRVECKMDLSSLHKTKLIYSHKSVSLFGKVLCKKWRRHRPYVSEVKNIFGHNPQIVRFDFSTPSPDTKILKYLKRNVS